MHSELKMGNNNQHGCLRNREVCIQRCNVEATVKTKSLHYSFFVGVRNASLIEARALLQEFYSIAAYFNFNVLNFERWQGTIIAF